MQSLSCSPRVVGTERADFSSLRALLDSPPYAEKSGEALILAIYDDFTSTVDGTYHFWPMDERSGSPRLRRSLYEPLKMLNAYGFMVCGQCSTLLYALYREAGFVTRQIGVPGHSLCEVFYEGRWHILDVDMWTWFRAPEGHIASAYELATDASKLIAENNNRSQPCNLPDRKLEDYARMYADTQTVDGHVQDIWPHWSSRAHTMDFYLRPGESMSRSQTQNGRFHMPQEWKTLLDRYKSEWRFGMPHERYEPFRTFGNGTWTYAPNLCARYHDFVRGVWEHSGVTQTDGGLECIFPSPLRGKGPRAAKPNEGVRGSPGPGPGTATFRVLSPYPFCGRPDWSGDRVISRDGVWLEFISRGDVRAEVTDAEGAWQPVDASSGSADITALLDGRYECLLRFTLEPGARLERFKFHGYTMTAPGSIPRLVQGSNAMQVRCLDSMHLRTEPWSQILDFRASADLRAQVAITNGKPETYVEGWQMISPDGGRPVQVVAKFSAPVARKFSWIYALASVREGQHIAPPKRASLEWSPDGGRWQPLGAIAIPNTPLQWDGSLDGSAVWETPRAEVFIRLSSETAISGLEFYGHLDIGDPHKGELRVRHRWTERGEPREFAAPPGASAYDVICGADPRDHTIKLRVDSLPAI